MAAILSLDGWDDGDGDDALDPEMAMLYGGGGGGRPLDAAEESSDVPGDAQDATEEAAAAVGPDGWQDLDLEVDVPAATTSGADGGGGGLEAASDDPDDPEAGSAGTAGTTGGTTGATTATAWGEWDAATHASGAQFALDEDAFGQAGADAPTIEPAAAAAAASDATHGPDPRAGSPAMSPVHGSADSSMGASPERAGGTPMAPERTPASTLPSRTPRFVLRRGFLDSAVRSTPFQSSSEQRYVRFTIASPEVVASITMVPTPRARTSPRFWSAKHGRALTSYALICHSRRTRPRRAPSTWM